jgi:hypothetical protein
MRPVYTLASILLLLLLTPAAARAQGKPQQQAA